MNDNRMQRMTLASVLIPLSTACWYGSFIASKMRISWKYYVRFKPFLLLNEPLDKMLLNGAVQGVKAATQNFFCDYQAIKTFAFLSLSVSRLNRLCDQQAETANAFQKLHDAVLCTYPIAVTIPDSTETAWRHFLGRPRAIRWIEFNLTLQARTTRVVLAYLNVYKHVFLLVMRVMDVLDLFLADSQQREELIREGFRNELTNLMTNLREMHQNRAQIRTNLGFLINKINQVIGCVNGSSLEVTTTEQIETNFFHYLHKINQNQESAKNFLMEFSHCVWGPIREGVGSTPPGMILENDSVPKVEDYVLKIEGLADDEDDDEEEVNDGNYYPNLLWEENRETLATSFMVAASSGTSGSFKHEVESAVQEVRTDLIPVVTLDL